MNEKKCYKEFKKIYKAKENHGYNEWNKLIIGELKSIPNLHNLQNLKKRMEFKLDKCEKNFAQPDFSHMFFSYLSIIITLFICFLTISSRIPEILFEVEKLINSNVLDVASDTISLTNDMYKQITTSIGSIIASVVIGFLIIYFCLNYSFNRAVYKRKFYDEVLKIIDLEIEKRNQEGENLDDNA